RPFPGSRARCPQTSWPACPWRRKSNRGSYSSMARRPGSCAVVLSPRTATATCRHGTGHCWCRPLTSLCRKLRRSSISSAFRAQAFPGFESPLSADELAGLSLEEEVESRIVLEHGATPWELRRGPFTEDSYRDLPARDWTLLVQAVDQFVPEVAEILDQFRFLPSWRVDDLMISFAAPGGSVGPHFDNYDVFLLQTHGHRRWKVGQMCD